MSPYCAVLCLGEFLNNYASPVGTGSKNSWTEEYKYELLCTEYGEGTEKIIEAFRKAYPDKNIADILFMDTDMRRNALAFARQRAEFSRAGVYNFLFTLESPFNGGTVPWHNAEIPYVFHNAEYLEPSFIPGITPAVPGYCQRGLGEFRKDRQSERQRCPAVGCLWRRGKPDHGF